MCENVMNEVIYNKDGTINFHTHDNMNLEKGLFSGVGFSLTDPDNKLIRHYTAWKTLNSHKLTIGTTRQGKSRKMMSDVEQQIASKANVFIGEPKGSAYQEIIGYTLQYALKYNRYHEIIYISPFHNKFSIRFNPFYKKKNEEISSLVGEIVESIEPVYKNIGRNIALAVAMSTEFLEKFDKLNNPYDVIIMERMEYARLEFQETNRINKFIWEDEYSEKAHGLSLDIKTDLYKNATDIEKKLIDEAIVRTEARYAEKTIEEGVYPLRSFITLKDLGQFEIVDNMMLLNGFVKKALTQLMEKDGYAELKRLGKEALAETNKRATDDQAFIKKLGTSFSMALTDLTTGDVGLILNDCKINPLVDSLTSNSRGAIIIYQPFPMIYSSASSAMGRIMFSTFTSIAGYVGASGYELKRRLYVNIDEAGSILSPIVQELANKGGGLKFSLCLYTQSIADIIDSLDETKCRIILDNMNTKEFFKVNDNTTADEIATMMGSVMKASASTAASDKRDTRSQVKVESLAIADTSIIQKLNERTFLLKEGNDVYLMGAPFVADALFKICMPIPSFGKMSEESDEKRNYVRKLLG